MYVLARQTRVLIQLFFIQLFPQPIHIYFSSSPLLHSPISVSKIKSQEKERNRSWFLLIGNQNVQRKLQFLIANRESQGEVEILNLLLPNDAVYRRRRGAVGGDEGKDAEIASCNKGQVQVPHRQDREGRAQALQLLVGFQLRPHELRAEFRGRVEPSRRASLYQLHFEASRHAGPNVSRQVFSGDAGVGQEGGLCV